MPLIALPTTAGTGSEATPVSVITDPKTEMKIGVASPHLIPRHAICDPLLTVGAPPTVTAHAGIDALSHAVEAYMAAREEPGPDLVLGRPQVGKNLLSDTLALTAAEHLARNLARAVEDGSDLEARTGMLYGSLLAGIAFGNSGVSAAHALQFAVGAATHTSHGLGTGLLLPYCMEFNRPAREPELAELERIFGAEPVAFVHELGRRIGLPASLAEIGVAREDLRGMAEASVGIKRLIDNNPRPLDADASSASSTPPGTGAGAAQRGGWREVADRALEVRGHASDGGVDVAALDHVQQLAVLARHRRRAGPGRAQLGDAQPDLAAHREIEPLEARAADGARERVVEAEIGLHDLAPVRVRGQLGQAADRGVDLAERRGALEHLADDQALDRDPDAEQVADVVVAEDRDERAAVALALEQALVAERLDRGPDGRAGDAELARQVGLGERRPGRDRAVEDLLAQRDDDGFGRRDRGDGESGHQAATSVGAHAVDERVHARGGLLPALLAAVAALVRQPLERVRQAVLGRERLHALAQRGTAVERALAVAARKLVRDRLDRFPPALLHERGTYLV